MLKDGCSYIVAHLSLDVTCFFVMSDVASRRSAAGLAGVAPRLVPSRGHPLRSLDHSERSEAQLHEGDRVSKRSVERSWVPMDKNRIDGGAEQSERT